MIGAVFELEVGDYGQIARSNATTLTAFAVDNHLYRLLLTNAAHQP